jgi:hypothetical protein
MMVDVYWNIHKRIFSIRDVKTRLVIGHLNQLVLVNCTFRVSEAGRQRVVRTKRKNVHAVVRGNFLPGFLPANLADDWRVAKYNPYTAGCFMSEGLPVFKAHVVYCETWLGKPQMLTRDFSSDYLDKNGIPPFLHVMRPIIR